MLARMAGLSCGKEVRNVMLRSGKVPDVAIFQACHNIITDIRTVVGANSRYCAAAALFPGHGAVWGAARKNEAWFSHIKAKGDVFYALCHEAGGRMGDSAHDPCSDCRLRGGVVERSHGFQDLRPPAAACGELPRGRSRH